MSDFDRFVTSFLAGTQFLIFLWRALGARIGSDVIFSDINCLSDPQLVTIGDHVRISMGAFVQVIPKHGIVNSKSLKHFSFLLFFRGRKKDKKISSEWYV